MLNPSHGFIGDISRLNPKAYKPRLKTLPFLPNPLQLCKKERLCSDLGVRDLGWVRISGPVLRVDGIKTGWDYKSV